MEIKFFLIYFALLLVIAPIPSFASSPTINEFMAHPSSGNSEWVEFYNPDNLDLSSYWIDDDTSFTSDSGSSPKKSLKSLNTTNSKYPFIELNSFLNNSGDFVVLFSGDGTIIDQYHYTQDPGVNKTIGRMPDGGSWAVLAQSSKGASNGDSSPSPSPTPSSTPSQIAQSTSSPSNPSNSPNPQFTVSNIPSQINSDQSFTASVNLSLPNNPNTKFYIKGAFKKSDSTNYFGLTKVSDNWVKNSSNFSSQFPITTDSSGNWPSSLPSSLEVKPDQDDSGFVGNGDYIFKVGRYKIDGSDLTWSNETIMTINQSVSASASPSPSLTLLTTNNIPNIPNTPTSKKSFTPLTRIASIAGVSKDSTASATPSANIKIASQKQTTPFVWIGAFLVLVGISSISYLVFKSKKGLVSR